MEICIIGAGAMGGLFAALLAPFAPVILLENNAALVETIRRDGLSFTGMDGERRRIAVRILQRPEEAPSLADLALIFTKSRSTLEAAAAAAGMLKPQGLVLSLQNGLGNIETLRRVFAPERIFAGVTAQAATTLGLGEVRHAGRGLTQLAPVQAAIAELKPIVALFTFAGIETEVRQDHQALIWSKLLVNVGINALAALLRVPNGVLCQIPSSLRLMRLAVDEALAVSQALGIDLSPQGQLERVCAVCRQTATNRASMLQDILRHAETEVEAINGAIAVKGQELGVATPVNELLTLLVKAMEESASQRI